MKKLANNNYPATPPGILFIGKIYLLTEFTYVSLSKQSPIEAEFFPSKILISKYLTRLLLSTHLFLYILQLYRYALIPDLGTSQ